MHEPVYGYFEVNLNNTRSYGPCQPETHLHTVVRRASTIDSALRTTHRATDYATARGARR